jgi:hypothetical protein
VRGSLYEGFVTTGPAVIMMVEVTAGAVARSWNPGKTNPGYLLDHSMIGVRGGKDWDGRRGAGKVTIEVGMSFGSRWRGCCSSFRWSRNW